MLSLSRNFGKEAALSAGLDHAGGDAVVPMDVDLQDPPEVLVEMVARWRAGFDVVYGVRRSRRSDSAAKRATAGLFYVQAFTAAEPVRRVERAHGRSKFNGWRLWTLALDGITSSSTMPLRIWSYLGGAVALAALAYAAWMVVQTLAYGSPVAGYPSIFVAVLFLGGVQLVSLGILGEYVGRILIEAKQRPLYVVRDRIGFDAEG